MRSVPNEVPPLANGEYAFGPTRLELRAGPADSAFNQAYSRALKWFGLGSSAMIHVAALAALYFGHGEHPSASPQAIPVTLAFLAEGDTPQKTKSPRNQKPAHLESPLRSNPPRSLDSSAMSLQPWRADTKPSVPVEETHAKMTEPIGTPQQSDVRKVDPASVPNVTEPEKGKRLPISHAPITKVDNNRLASSSSTRHVDRRQSYELSAPHRTGRDVPNPERLAAATAPPWVTSMEQSLASDRGDKAFFEESNIASLIGGLESVEFRRPRSLHGNRPPIYPRRARELGLQGKVVVAAEVMPDGHCGRVSVIHSSGYAELDDAARDAILHWRFTPAIQDGRKIVATIEVPVRFRLTD